MSNERIVDIVSGSLFGARPPRRTFIPASGLADLDVFVKQHCKEQLEKEKSIIVEISDHMDGRISYDKLSADSKEILDIWSTYCGDIDKKIAR